MKMPCIMMNAAKLDFKENKAKDCIEALQERFGNVFPQIVTHRLPFTDYEKAFKIPSKNRIKVVLNWE